VLKYAAGIGLPGAQGLGLAHEGKGFDDRDFRPPGAKAKQKSKGKGKGSGKRNAPSDPNKPSSRGDGGSATKGRPWNEGAGPMPMSLAGTASLENKNDDEDFSGIWHLLYPADDHLKSYQKTKNDGPKVRITGKRVEELRGKGEELLDNITKQHEMYMKSRGSQDAKWLLTARSKGTVKDKIAAAALLVQGNAVANLGSLELLLSWVTRNKGSRDGVAHAIDALSELFSDSLLPDDRKLRFVHESFAPPRVNADRYLVLRLVEDRIKKCYNEFVGGLEALSKDNIEHLKQKATKTAFNLLSTKPEQEGWLLSILVNKLGDPSRKIASNAVFLLHKLFESHPGMKPIVAQEVENFLFRPGLSDRAQYTSVIFLNQIVLSKREFEGGSFLAEKLVDIYFAFFQKLVKQADDHWHQAKTDQSPKSEKENTGKKRQRKGDNAGARGKAGNGVRAASSQGEADSKMLSALLTGINRAFPFVSSSKYDDLIEKHGPKLFQLVHAANFGTCVQAMILLFQLYNSKMALSDRYYRALYSCLLNKELTKSSKTPLLLSLVFKSLKQDVNKVRVAAFLNRLLQVSVGCKSNFTCGSLLILSETMKHFPALWAYVNESSHGSQEAFTDVQEHDDSSGSDDEKHANNEDGAESEQDGDCQEGQLGKKDGHLYPRKTYDMHKRDPQHCGMDESCFWELSLLSRHFHPSVSVMTRTLLAGANIVYDGDPLRDLNMVSFLGKFVSKKPKEHSSAKFSKSAHQAQQPSALAKSGTEALASLDEDISNPHDVFFHKYYAQKAKGVAGSETSGSPEGLLGKEAEEVFDDAVVDNDGGDPDYAKLGEAMFGHEEGEDDDSEVVSSSEDGDDKDARGVSKMESPQAEATRGRKSLKETTAPSSRDGPFAPLEAYEDQIQMDLTDAMRDGRPPGEIRPSQGHRKRIKRRRNA